MPGKKQRSSAKTAKRKSASPKPGSSRRARRKGAPQPGEGLLIDVARSVGSTLGALAARSGQAADRLRAAAGKKRS